MTVGDRLRKLRREKGWDQKECAQRVDIHPRHLSRYENGHVHPPRKVLLKFAEVFGVTVEDLTQDDPRQHLATLVPDEELLEQFQKVAQMDEEDRRALKRILSALIMKQQMQQMLASR